MPLCFRIVGIVRYKQGFENQKPFQASVGSFVPVQFDGLHWLQLFSDRIAECLLSPWLLHALAELQSANYHSILSLLSLNSVLCQEAWSLPVLHRTGLGFEVLAPGCATGLQMLQVSE